MRRRDGAGGPVFQGPGRGWLRRAPASATPRLAVPALALGTVLAPAPARACAVCWGGDAGSLLAYFLTGVVLSALPLSMLGAFLLWVRRRARHPGATGSPGA